MILTEKYTLQCKGVDGKWRDTTSAATLVSLEKAKEEREIFDNIFSHQPDVYKVVEQRIVKVTTEVVE